MEEKEVIQLLRHYRHDLMNHLQIVQGYLSMGKMEKAQKKLMNYMQILQEEGKLVNMHAPAFALYLLQFDSLHTNFRLTYHIHTENKNLQSVDRLLVEHCEQVMKKIEHVSDGMELYELNVRLYDESFDTIGLAFTVNGNLPDVSSLQNTMTDKDDEATMYQGDNEIKYIVSVQVR